MSNPESSAPFLGMEFPVEVWLASEDVQLGRLLELMPGEVLSLAKSPDSEVDLVINGSTIASGELVVVDGKFGFRITSTLTQKLAGLDEEGGEEKLS
jgi:flagellar motor switch protein FliN/FliY